MGADIHGYIEYSNDGSHWNCWAGRISLIRRYNIFGLIAGVRSGATPLVPLRGIPEDLSFDVIEDYYGSPKRLDELSGHEKAEVEAYHVAKVDGTTPRRDVLMRDQHIYLANPDWHSAGWLWMQEYDRVMQILALPASSGPADPCWLAVGAAMMGLAGSARVANNSVRFVFFFDN